MIKLRLCNNSKALNNPHSFQQDYASFAKHRSTSSSLESHGSIKTRLTISGG